MASLHRTVSIRVANQLSTPPQTTACQKLMILLATATFIALCSLTASLPLNLPRHQDSEALNPAAFVSGGNIMWMMVAATFGTLLAPTLAYFYANIYGRSSSLLVQVVTIMGAMISVLWIVLSFSLVYGQDANEDKILGYPKSFYMFAHTNNNMVNGVPVSIIAIFELTFAILTPTIVAAAIIDRVNVYGFLAFIFVWHLTIYSPVAHIVWSFNGFFKTNEIEDFSGGIVVHMLASVTVVAAHLYLDWKKAPKQEPRPPHAANKVLLSSLAIWFLWFGINAGKAWGASSVAAQSIVNTIGGVMTSVLLNYFIDVVYDIPFTEVTASNAILLGLVSSTPSSGYVTVGGAMVITCFVTVGTRLVANVFMKESHSGPYTVATVHGLGGSIAFLMTALISYNFVNPNGGALNGLTYGHQTPIRHHVAAILAVWSCGFLSILLCLFLCDLIVPLSRTETSADKDEFAPTPLGPQRTNSGIEHPNVYKQQSTFSVEQPAAAADESAEAAPAAAETA